MLITTLENIHLIFDLYDEFASTFYNDKVLCLYISSGNIKHYIQNIYLPELLKECNLNLCKLAHEKNWMMVLENCYRRKTNWHISDKFWISRIVDGIVWFFSNALWHMEKRLWSNPKIFYKPCWMSSLYLRPGFGMITMMSEKILESSESTTRQFLIMN